MRIKVKYEDKDRLVLLRNYTVFAYILSAFLFCFTFFCVFSSYLVLTKQAVDDIPVVFGGVLIIMAVIFFLGGIVAIFAAGYKKITFDKLRDEVLIEKKGWGSLNNETFKLSEANRISIHSEYKTSRNSSSGSTDRRIVYYYNLEFNDGRSFEIGLESKRATGIIVGMLFGSNNSSAPIPGYINKIKKFININIEEGETNNQAAETIQAVYTKVTSLFGEKK